MNVWYRQVILLTEGFDTEKKGAVFHAIQEVLGAGDGDKAYVPPSAQFAFETESQDPLQDDDYQALKAAIRAANERPVAMTIQEHRITESDPDEVKYDLEGRRG